MEIETSLKSDKKERENNNGSWAENEEMVDWFAIQSPKIYEIYKKLNIL